MVIELLPKDFFRVVPLLAHPLLSAEARSVANGNSPGWIFVDDDQEPQVALVWSKGIEGFFVAGDPGQQAFVHALDHNVRQVITPRARALGWEWFEVSGCSPDWDAALARAFAGRPLEKETDLIYRLKKASVPPPRALPAGAALHQLDRAFFKAPPCKDISFIQDKIRLFWAGLDSFLDSGIGFCATQDSALASVCLTGFVAEEVHVIDIETLEPFRRSGLGYQVGRAFIAHCLKNGLQPHWGCMEENEASHTLAENLGLERVMEYLVFYFPLETDK